MEVRFQPGLNSIRALNIKNNNQSNVCFTGLSKTVKSHIFLDPRLLQQINGVHNTDIVGEPPVEFIQALKKSDCPKEKIRAEAKKLMESFSLASSVLRRAEEHSFDGHDFQVLEFARDLNKVLEGGNPYVMQNSFQRLLKMQASRPTFSPVLDEAAMHIDKAFKDAGILPEDGRAGIEFLSEGGRGYAFKVSFLDANGEKVFHDKILKLYRSPLSDATKKIAETVHRYTSEEPNEYFKLCKDEMTEYYTAHADKLPNYYNLSPKVLVDIAVDDYMLLVEDFQRDNKNKSFEELYTKYNDFADAFVAGHIDHGVYAEANRALYLKDKVGNIQIFDYIEPWFFNLKTGYSVFEYSDNELPAIRKKLDLGKYGLYHSDLDHRPENVVNGRVIDYGGIRPIEKTRV